MNKRRFNKLQKELVSALESGMDTEIAKTIQAMAEGETKDVMLDNLLTGFRLSGGIEGLTNEYRTYNSQVLATYRKYNNRDDFGNNQVRAIVDIRSSFIASEGLNVSCEDKATAQWLKEFIRENKLEGSFLLNSVKSSEMAGRTLLHLKVIRKEGEETKVKLYRYGCNGSSLNYEIKEGKALVKEKKEGSVETENIKATLTRDFFNVIIGGDDTLSDGATTKVGLALAACENYDRAVKDMRRLNHVLARITPVIKADSEQKAGQVRQIMNKIKWKIGMAFVSSAEFKYEVPSSGAHENLKSELAVNVKDIQAVTGIPVHWLGHTDLMSNRATADTLYETIKNATTYERTVWAETFKDILIKAQELYINNGGNKIQTVNKDFEVRIPIIDFSNFLEKVRGWSIAYDDGAVSIDDYMNSIPGINPLATKKAIEAKQKEEESNLLPDREKVLETLNSSEEEDDG